METPMSYAVQLCSYIASPTKIEKLIEIEFGKGRAPPLHIIAGMRTKVEIDKKKFFGRGNTTGRDMRRELAKIKKEGPRKIKVKLRPKCPADKIIDLVCKHFMISQEGLFSRSRHPLCISAKYVAAKLFEDAGYDREETGVQLDRDKSRIGKMLRQWPERIEQSTLMANAYEKLRPIVMGEA